MNRLKLLIVCLLVVFKATSQTATKDSVVILSEATARKVVKDLVRLDFCVQISKEQEKIIDLQNKKITAYKELTSELEKISKDKTAIIENQKEIISKIQAPKLHLYVGIRNDLLQINNTTAYSNLLFCMKKIDFGIHTNLNINSKITYGITAQYRIF